MTVSGGSSISVPMIESRRSVYVVCPGAFTPPTESLKRVSPVNTTATPPPSKPPGPELAPGPPRRRRPRARPRRRTPGRCWRESADVSSTRRSQHDHRAPWLHEAGPAGRRARAAALAAAWSAPASFGEPAGRFDQPPKAVEVARIAHVAAPLQHPNRRGAARDKGARLLELRRRRSQRDGTRGAHSPVPGGADLLG